MCLLSTASQCIMHREQTHHYKKNSFTNLIQIQERKGSTRRGSTCEGIDYTTPTRGLGQYGRKGWVCKHYTHTHTHTCTHSHVHTHHLSSNFAKRIALWGNKMNIFSTFCVCSAKQFSSTAVSLKLLCLCYSLYTCVILLHQMSNWFCNHVACRADCRPNFACPDISCHCMQEPRPCLLLWWLWYDKCHTVL